MTLVVTRFSKHVHAQRAQAKTNQRGHKLALRMASTLVAGIQRRVALLGAHIHKVCAGTGAARWTASDIPFAMTSCHTRLKGGRNQYKYCQEYQ